MGRKSIRLFKNCKLCQTQFSVSPYYDRLKFCSQSCYWESKKGSIGYWRGKNRSKETKEKISKTKRADPNIRGENAWQWKGGKYTENYRERRRFQKVLQKSVLERDNYTCQICEVRGGVLHVDHIQLFSEYLEGRFEINNCRTLCRSCHYMVTFKRPMPKNSKWGLTFMRKVVV